MIIKIDASSSYAGRRTFDNKDRCVIQLGWNRILDHMENIILKQEDQTIWYENDGPIKEYLESSKKLSKKKAVSPEEKLSLLKLFKKSMADPAE